MDYMTYLSRSEEGRELLPPPILTVRWCEGDQLRDLHHQSWFARLRGELNRGSKITVNLGAFKFEHAGVAKETESLPPFALARQIFSKTQPVGVAAFVSLLNSSLGGRESTVFEPSLVVIDGELSFVLDEVRLLELMLREIAERFGFRLEGQPPAGLRYDEAILSPAVGALNQLGEEIFGNEAQQKRLKSWLDNAENLWLLHNEGRQYLRGALLGLDSTSQPTVRFDVGFPPTAILNFPDKSGFGVRVLGWTEHTGGGHFFVRAIAAATVDAFTLGVASAARDS